MELKGVKRRYTTQDSPSETESQEKDSKSDQINSKKPPKSVGSRLWPLFLFLIAFGLVYIYFQYQQTLLLPQSSRIVTQLQSANSKISELQQELQKAQSVIQKLNDRDSQFKESGKKRRADSAPISIWKVLPSSDVWCKGTSRLDRICRFRNLCYMPERDQFFIAKTSRSIIENVPFNNSEMALLELSTVENHTVFYWHYEEINPYDSKFQNIVMRYEEMPHFLFSRLHPRNVMHNIHDDVLGMFFLLREIMGGGDERHKMHFSLDSHRVLLLDPYGKTDSTRPLQYLSKYPVRFKNSYLAKDKNVITCFRDATVGNTKVATFYQYGFSSPQSKIPHKELNGMFIREVAEWYVRRIGLQMGFDEDMTSFPSVSSKKSVFGNRVSSVDLRESDIIVILSRKGNRLILNEDELAKYLTDRFKLETIFVRNEDHTFEEQVGYLRRARIVLGMHGSILMMIMFCRRGTVIVEMFPFGVPSAHYTPYKTLSELTGMNLVYRAWENKQEENSVGHPEYHELLGGFGQLSEAKKKEVLETKTVPEHICCSSPFWLYRIYQDTQVNLQEVGNTIEEAVTFSRREILSSLYETNYDAPNFIKPPTVMNASCIDGSKRQPGEIWARWDSPWNNAKVDQWNIFILNSQTEYVTRDHKPTFAIGGFNPGEVVEFQLRPLVYGKYRAPWGAVCECIA